MAVQRSDGVIQGGRCRRVLPDHQQTGIRQIGHALRVRSRAHGGQVKHDKVEALPRPVQQRVHPWGNQQVAGVLLAAFGKQHVHIAVLIAQEALGQILLAPQNVVKTVGEFALPQHHAAGGLPQVAVDQQNTLALLLHGQRQIDSHGGLALVFQQARHYQHLAAVHVLLDPAAQLADTLHKPEAGHGVRDQNAGFLPPQQGKNGFVLPLVGDLAQIAAVQLLPGFRTAPHRVPQIGQNGKQGRGGQRRDDSGFFHLVEGKVLVRGRCGHCRVLQHLQPDVIYHLIGQGLVVLDDGLRGQKGHPGIGIRYGHGDQVGVGDDRGVDGSIKGGNVRLLQDGLAHDGAVQQFGKQSRKIAGGGQVGIHRRGAAPGGHHEGGRRPVDRRVCRVRINVGADTHGKRRQHNNQPPLENVLHKDDGVEGQKPGALHI